jgi:hypothetical protein
MTQWFDDILVAGAFTDRVLSEKLGEPVTELTAAPHIRKYDDRLMFYCWVAFRPSVTPPTASASSGLLPRGEVAV